MTYKRPLKSKGDGKPNIVAPVEEHQKAARLVLVGESLQETRVRSKCKFVRGLELQFRDLLRSKPRAAFSYSLQDGPLGQQLRLVLLKATGWIQSHPLIGIRLSLLQSHRARRANLRVPQERTDFLVHVL